MRTYAVARLRSCSLMLLLVWLLPSGSLAQSIPGAAPRIVSIVPAPGLVTDRLDQVTVTFSEPVVGVDIDDLLVNNLPTVGVSSDETATEYTFRLLQPSFGEVRFSWTSVPGILDTDTPAMAFDGTASNALWKYDLVDTAAPVVSRLFPEPNALVRSFTQLEVNFSEDVTGVDAGDLLINGVPAPGLTTFAGGRYLFQFASPAVGTVRLKWAAGHGITDLAASPHPFPGGEWVVTLDPTTPYGDLVINEILAANQNGLKDEDSTAADPQPQDWIEIYNRGTDTVNLSGWSLSDDQDTPGLWTFPTKLLGPGQYLVVFASGKDRRAPTGNNRFHTNFKLSPQGEFLGLFTPDSPRILASSLGTKYPEQRNDFSYGPDSEGNLRYFSAPTPGGANGRSTIASVCQPVHFSAGRGHYTVPIGVVLTTETPGAFIRYTTDGSEPTLNTGAVYLNPVPITKNTVLRAAAFRDDLLSSTIETHTYLFKQSASVRALPILSIVTATKNLTGPTGILGIGNNYDNPNEHGIAWERPVSAELINLKDNSGFQVNCGLRVHGSDYTRPRYTAESKFSYRLYFRGDYGQGRLEYPFFADSPLQSYDQIVLRAGHNDEVNPFLTDEYVRQIAADTGQVACHGNFVNLFINGVYKGYYNPAERVEEPFLQTYQGGGEKWDIITVNSVAQAGDTVAWNSLLNYVRQQNIATTPVYQEVLRRLDVTNFVDYLFVNIHAATWDWPHNNFRAARERVPNGLWRFYVWDAEGGYLSGRGPDFNQLTTTDSGFGTSSEISDLFNRLRLNADFRLLFADRVHKLWFNNGPMVETNMSARFIEMRAELLPVISGFDSSILTTWIPRRRTPLTTQLTTARLFASSNAPVMNQFGGRVPTGFSLTLTNRGSNSVIYYTLSGGDPRVPFTSGVAPEALRYETPLIINESVLVNARTLQNGTNWSALSSASFTVDERGIPLRITEIMYNPVGGTPYEFIELQNVGGTTLDIGGISLEGVSFIFPVNTLLAAGGRVVLGSDADPTAFKARYPGVAVAGTFAGNLSNGGERLALRDRGGRVIVSVDYRDDNGWPEAADGGGSSLEILDPRGDPDAPANWQASRAPNGTPGAPRVVPSTPAVRISEILAADGNDPVSAADWIELYNFGSSQVNVGNWSLSDDGNPRKFVFPAGTLLGAGAYLRIWCDSATNQAPGLHTGFGLAARGESVLLYDAATNRVDGVAFGPQASGYSLAWTQDGYRLAVPSPNASNVLTEVTEIQNLSVNEWMANPLSGTLPWIELFNRSTNQPLALENLYVGTSNSLQQVRVPSFLPPGGHLQLFIDSAPGPDHLDLSLAPTNGVILVYDPTGAEVLRVNYGNQSPGVSQGRFPDGTTNVTTFPGSASPGAANYLNTYTGPVLNEVQAENLTFATGFGHYSDWVELYNPGVDRVDLAGMSLSFDVVEPGQWQVPPGVGMEGGGYLVLWCDASQPASLVAGPQLNTGHSLRGSGGGVYLFDARGQLVNQVEYGFQLADGSIGRDSGGWKLMSTPSPGQVNGEARNLGSSSAARLNEWMANPWSGDDWFELYNLTNLPIDLGGLVLSDDPSSAYTNKFRIRPLSFVEPRGWVKWIADAKVDAGPNHVNFSLNAEGDVLRLYSAAGAILDAVDFGREFPNVSSGRYPDGHTNVVSFPGAASPGTVNHFVLEGPIVVSEILANTASPLEDAIELQNLGSVPFDASGWFLSNDPRFPKKFRLPQGTVLAPGKFVVLYDYFQQGVSEGSFSLDGERGGVVWLFAASPQGELTGAAASAAFGPSLVNVSFGRRQTLTGTEYVMLQAPTFGVATPASVAEFRTGFGRSNSIPRVGPLVISEVMYHPPSGSASSVEYIELQNISSQPLALGSSAVAAERWRLQGAVEFAFTQGTVLPAGGRILVVDFSPAKDLATLNAFRSKFSIPAAVPVQGPFLGKLSNEGESLELWEPVPSSEVIGQFFSAPVELVAYEAIPPWPAGDANGGGASLQRRNLGGYANDPLNWAAVPPTPGLENRSPLVALPVIKAQPLSQAVFIGDAAQWVVGVEGAGPLTYQWRYRGLPLSGATNVVLAFEAVAPEDAGFYDVVINNPGGSVFSEIAQLETKTRVAIHEPPRSQVARVGTNVTFNVIAAGQPPLTYQWQFNGVDIPGAVSNSLTRLQVGAADTGEYMVKVTDAASSRSASASLEVIFPPVVTLHPQPQAVLVGDTVTFTAAATGTTPMTFRWRKGSATVSNLVSTTGSSRFVLANVKTTSAGNYVVSITNAANTTGVLSATVPLLVLVDTDKDRIPDVWETANGSDPNNANDSALDPDRDGLTNLQEYQTGTDPRSAASYLRVGDVTQSLGNVEISFNAVSNRTYSLLFKDEVTDLTWNLLTSTLARSTNRIEKLVDPVGTNRARVYRLVTPAQ